MLGRLFDRWASAKQTRELKQFVDLLSAADGSEVGMVVACATDWRNKLRGNGLDLLEPSLLIARDPMVTFKLSNTVKRLQRDRAPELACGLMVWVHTLRALDHPELRALGRDMWRELARGFPHAEHVASEASAVAGIKFDTRNADQFPTGLTPERLDGGWQ